MKIIKTTVVIEFTEEEEKAITTFLQIKDNFYNSQCNKKCFGCPFRSLCESGIHSIDEFKDKLTFKLEE